MSAPAGLHRSFPSVGPIEHSHRTNFQRWYEFEGKGPQGQELDVEISEDGERILIQTDTAGEAGTREAVSACFPTMPQSR